jgi:hypothetical protein
MRRGSILGRGSFALTVAVTVGGAVGGVFTGGCGSTADSEFKGDGGPDGSRGGRSSLDGTLGADAPQSLGGGTTKVTALTLKPANPTVTVKNGVIPAAIGFEVEGTIGKGGQSETITGGTWSFDRPDIGSVSATGKFTASGLVGGTGKVTVTTDGLSASTNVTVKLQMTLDPGGVAATLGPKFAAATMADPQMAVDYPYDKTIFPRGLPAPVPQWCLGAAPSCTGNATDVYDIKITTPTATFEEFTTTATPAAPSFTLPTSPVDVWSTLTSSTTGPMTFSIARYDGTNAYQAQTESWTIASANLAGTIYYWEIDLGTVVKMPVGQGPSAFLQIPTNTTPAITCEACHSVSKNGTTVVTAFNGSASPWGTFDTSTGSSIFVDGTDPSNGPAGSGFEAISPDGSWILWGQEQANPFLNLNPSSSATTVTMLAPGVATSFPSQPAWSPDGNHVAFAMRSDGDWLDYSTSDLWTSDVDLTASPPAFSNTHLLVSGVATRPTTTYPSFSPDTKWLAFERSTQVRSRGAQSELWLSSLDGTTLQSLDAANTGTGLYTQTDATYEPTFMPVAVGGYFWLVFVSERVYGNTLTDTNEGDSTTPGRHKQLWVTAIDANPTPGQDPSHPAFWLPGQNTADQNMRGEWALDPCKTTGQGCSGGYECCAGFCATVDGGAPVCTTASSSGCSGAGDACKTASDCCDSSESCVGGFCNTGTK